MSNAQLLQSWRPVESRRTGLVQAAAATLFVVCGAHAGDDAAQQIKFFGTGSTLQTVQSAERGTQSTNLSVELKTIKDALGLSVSELAQLFGVTRPTIYSWQGGSRVTEGHAKRIRDIARAIEPRLSLLDTQVGRIAHRAINGRATLFQILREGEDVAQTMDKVADILQREAAQRERLAARLRGRSTDRGGPDLDVLG